MATRLSGRSTSWASGSPEALGGPGYEGVPSGRVRDVPDLRTIRYYTTLGLLDRPAAMRGRTALYGPRHLLQLVAIKRLQARGLSLAAVQERVVGLSDAALRRLAAAEAAATKADVTPRPRGVGSRAESFCAFSRNRTKTRPTEESPGVQDVPLEAGLVLSLAAGTETGRRRPPRDPHGGGPVDRNTQAARADRRRPLTTKERRCAMTTTRSRPLPLLDEVTPSSPADDRDEHDAGFGALETARGRLPLTALDVDGPDRRPVIAGDGPPDVRERHGRAARGDVHLPASRPRRGDRLPHGGGRARGRGSAQGARAGAP